MAVYSVPGLTFVETSRPKSERFKCWIDEIQERDDACEIEALDAELAAGNCIEKAHGRGALSCVGEDDSFVVNVEAEDGTTSRWRVTARVTLWFDASPAN
jgi:hypothetical protein